MPRLKVQELSFGYRRRRKVLDAISFAISPGEVVGLLGVNGAGKSTLFRILSGLYYFDAGDIFFDDQLVARGGSCVSSFMRSRMGVVFQECSIDTKLSAETNLMLSGQVYGVERSQLKQKITSGLDEFGLRAVAGDAVKTFSGGMKRKLELLRAMLHAPEFLLMDEPSAGLDHEGFHHFWNRVGLEREQRDLTVLVATHRVDEAEKCDRLLVLHEGALVASDSPSGLKSRVRGDRICLRFRQNAEQEQTIGWLQMLRDAFGGIDVDMVDDEVRVIADDGHKLVPRLVEVLPDSAVESVYVRRPTLADAFLQLTGARL